MTQTQLNDLWHKAVDSLVPLTERYDLYNLTVTLHNDNTLLVQGDELAVWLATVKHKEHLEQFLSYSLQA